MNWVAFKQALLGSRRAAVLVALVNAAFFWVVLLASSTFLTASGGQVPPIFQRPPRVMQAFVGGSADFTNPVGWVSSGLLHPIILTMTAIGGLIVVTRAGATELEQGTLDLVLSRPIGRRPYLIARAAAAMILLSVAEFGSFVGAAVAHYTVPGVDILSIDDIGLTFAGHWLLFASFSMIGLWVFARSSIRSRALGTVIGIIVSAFFLNFLSLLFDGLKWLGYITPFHYYNGATILEHGDFLVGWLVLAVVALVAFTAALHDFTRRDLTR